MRRSLLIRIGQEPAAGCHWVPLDADGRTSSVVRSGSLEEAAVEAQGLRVIALVPGVDCLLTSVRMPGRSNRQKQLRAIPYLLEEQLSDEVEDLHFAVGELQPDGEYPVAIIAMRCMNAYTEAFRDARLDIARMIPDILAVPCTGTGTCAVVDDDLALVRTGPSSGFAVDADNVGMFLDSDVQVADDTDADTPPVRLLVPAGSGPYVREDAGIEVQSYHGNVLAVLAEGLDGGSIDLLQGAYSRTREWGRLLRPWRATAALLVAGFLLSHVVMGIDYYRLGKEQERLAQQIEGIYRETFPGTQRVVNPRVQMQQQLEQLQSRQGAGGQFLLLLARSGDVLHNTGGIEITGASYRSGRLDIDLTATSLQLLDQLKQTLGSKGLDVEIQSATTETGQRVKSRLRIQGRSV